MTVANLRSFVDQKKGELNRIKKDILDKEDRLLQVKEEVDDLILAKWILSETSNLTKTKVKDYVESLVTMAITSVWDRDYKFLCDFELKRNKPECLLRVQEGDNEPYVPEYDQGGSILDVISYALRVVMWSMANPRTMPVFYLDEPLRMVGSGTSEEIARTIDMMKRTSRELGLQLIINTHEEEISAIADRLFTVTHSGKYSVVESLVSSQEIGSKVVKPMMGSIPISRFKSKGKKLLQ